MYSPLRHVPALFYKNRAIQLTFFLTARCNAKCPFCFYLQGDNQQLQFENPVNRELSLEEISKVSASMGDLLWLALSGGEIFLRKDLAQICRIFYQNNRPVYILLPSNGMLPERIHSYTETIARQCPQSVIIVKLSIDGVGEQHDQLRRTPGSFSKTMESYRRLSELKQRFQNLELGVNTVFCAQNQNTMQSIIDHVEGLDGVDTHTISLIRGQLNEKSYKEVDMELYWYFAEQLADKIQNNQSRHYRFKGGKLKIAQDILQRQLIRETQRQQRRLIPCFAGKSNLVLTENGDVFPCESFQENLGNVRDFDGDMNRLLRSPRARQLVQSVRTAQCFCTHECYFITNIMLNPWLYPAVFKQYLKINAA